MGEDSRRIQSVGRAFEILEFVRVNGGVTVTELAGELGVSKATAHHYLATMTADGYLTAEEGTYDLGLSLLALGGAARSRSQLYDHARSTVDELAADTGELVQLWTEHDDWGIVLYQAHGRVGDVPLETGSREPLYCTAAGKAFLAELPREAVDRIVAATGFERYTDRTITDADALAAELSTVRSQGVAFDEGERFEEIRCVASPVRSVSGDPLGAISVTGPADRLSGERFTGEIPRKIRNVAGTVEITSVYADWTGE